ncbi:hypothetical protein [Xylophilus sp.]|uniref:hypothetical protein n=1 Tax=Xylophilus sp. TaxID=2653893 RepID=UPI0013B8837C|nr:hypothetical protein [Xylophilus sp.]KAF1047070.1 MAG: hypothetical protein GAK38_02114 [Xylophilus sp.]
MPLIKTPAGQQAFKERQGPIAVRLRPAFILFDGKRSTADVVAATGSSAEDVASLCGRGLLAEAAAAPDAGRHDVDDAPAGGPDGDAGAPPAPGVRSQQQRYLDAYYVAIKFAGQLGLLGFRLSLAVESARSYAELAALAPRIREAVGEEKFAAFDRALNG